VYKISAKFIAVWLNKLLSKFISSEKFIFLEGRQIHDAIDATYDGLHSVKMMKQIAIISKLDLSNAYNKVSWIYIKLLLIQIGFSLSMANWIMSCVMLVSFTVLVNDVASPLFNTSRGIHKDSLSPRIYFYWL